MGNCCEGERREGSASPWASRESRRERLMRSSSRPCGCEEDARLITEGWGTSTGEEG